MKRLGSVSMGPLPLPPLPFPSTNYQKAHGILTRRTKRVYSGKLIGTNLKPPQTPEEIEEWIKQRKARYPTAQRVAQKVCFFPLLSLSSYWEGQCLTWDGRHKKRKRRRRSGSSRSRILKIQLSRLPFCPRRCEESPEATNPTDQPSPAQNPFKTETGRRHRRPRGFRFRRRRGTAGNSIIQTTRGRPPQQQPQ